MVGWHHGLNGHEFEQALEVGDGQGSLACCSAWGHGVGHDSATKTTDKMMYRNIRPLMEKYMSPSKN